MRILVVGASGFIGRRIVLALRSAGHWVICAGRNVPALAGLFPGCQLLQARLTLLRPFLVATLCAIWIGSGVVSACVGTTESGTLLARLGLHGRAATGVVLAGASLDVALGAALLKPAFRATAARAQLLTMALYTTLATVALPALWADPFAPLLKNLAVAAATLVLLATEA
jgi:NAD(P)-dependent dehydrogenase (short-subunit alcohol dehydrogenase family)